MINIFVCEADPSIMMLSVSVCVDCVEMLDCRDDLNDLDDLDDQADLDYQDNLVKGGFADNLPYGIFYYLI